MNPQTNNQPTGNQSQFFGQKVSIPGINVNSAGDNQLIMQDNYSTRIYYNNAGIATVLLGTRLSNSNNDIGTSQQGFYVSQSGIDVRNATDSQLIFNSEQDVFKVINKISSNIPSFTVGSGQTKYSILTIPHGLSFIPIVNVYASGFLINFNTGASISSTYTALPINPTSINAYYFSGAGVTTYSLTILHAVDDTNIYIQASSAFNSTPTDTIQPIPVTIFVLQETAS